MMAHFSEPNCSLLLNRHRTSYYFTGFGKQAAQNLALAVIR